MGLILLLAFVACLGLVVAAVARQITWVAAAIGVVLVLLLLALFGAAPNVTVD